jgi:Arc/MetJ-type ribon-helix-helix transcriptional regulator
VTSRDVGRAAIRLALTETREEEARLKASLRQMGIRAVAVDFGGEYGGSIPQAVERILIASRREGILPDDHVHQGAAAGACREALSQLQSRALGFNLGGKMALAYGGEHLAAAVYAGIGLAYLDDQGVAVAHRAVPMAADAGRVDRTGRPG